MFRSLLPEQFHDLKGSLGRDLVVVGSLPDTDICNGWKLCKVGQEVKSLAAPAFSSPRVRDGVVQLVFSCSDGGVVKASKSSVFAAKLFLASVTDSAAADSTLRAGVRRSARRC